MNILILGATGRIGSKLLVHALNDGHNVTALLRNPSNFTFKHNNLTVLKGDVLNKKSIEDVMGGIDIVLSALSTDGTNTLSLSMPFIVSAMKSHKVKRIISVGTAGILQSRNSLNLLRYENNESRQKSNFAAKEHRIVYRILKQSGLEWTIICPTHLTEGNFTGKYRVERNYLPLNAVKISFQDVAHFIHSQMYSLEYLRTRVGIAY